MIVEQQPASIELTLQWITRARSSALDEAMQWSKAIMSTRPSCAKNATSVACKYREGKMIDWPTAFSTAAQAIKLVNELRSIDKEVNLAELKLKIADLTSSLADIKLTLTEA